MLFIDCDYKKALKKKKIVFLLYYHTRVSSCTPKTTIYMNPIINMVNGHIYSLRNQELQLIGRYIRSNDNFHYFYAFIISKNNTDQFRMDDCIAKSGIIEIRKATNDEKWKLLSEEVTYGTI